MRARRPWLVGLEPLYGAGVGLRNALYNAGFFRAKELAWPVISVGSLSAGGAGKTPVVRMLANLLERRGVSAHVLSRGYGRNARKVEQVDATGPAERFGDEPLELARAGLRVFVGADRGAAGRLAERSAQGRAVHVLDDGFQHRQLARALDVVLLTREDVEDRLLPAGNLREPLRSLQRADAVVVRAEEAAWLEAVIARHTKAEIWVIERAVVLPAERVKRPVVFCGIARPKSFLRMLSEAGSQPVTQVSFPDHHRYRAEDMERLLTAARQGWADGFYTTAKDAVKLSASWRQGLEAVGPVRVVELQVSLVEEAPALRTILAVLGKEWP